MPQALRLPRGQAQDKLSTSRYLGFGSIERSRDARHKSAQVGTSRSVQVPNAECLTNVKAFVFFPDCINFIKKQLR